ncbi:hypothetical protein GCM10027519_42180 [Kineococcus endophyticus]
MAQQLYAPSAQDNLLRRTAEAAERSRLAIALGLDKGCDPEIGPRVAEVVAHALGEQPVGDVEEVGAADALALWVLGRLAHESALTHHTRQYLTGRGAEQGLRAVTWMHRWNDHFEQDRIRDIHLLLSGFPMAKECALSLLQGGQLEQSSKPFFLQALKQCGDAAEIDKVEAYCQLLFDVPLTFRWCDAPRDSTAIHLVASAQAAARPRIEIYHAGDRLFPLQGPGISFSLLAGSLDLAGPDASSAWHEKAVLEAAKKLAGKHAFVRAGVAWHRDAGQTRSHEGEIDALALTDGFVFDFQAKAASRGGGTERINTVRTDALAQHIRLKKHLKDGIHLIDRKRSKPLRKQLASGQNFHVPISVGIETHTEFSVGGGLSRDTIPRVITTLDHLRLVNDVVPEVFRAIYWLDRLGAEAYSLRFVDEVDFLGRWLVLLNGGDTGAVTDREFVFSGDWPLERYLVARNTTVGGISLEPHASEARRRLNEGSPVAVASTLYSILRKLQEKQVSGHLPFLYRLVNWRLDELDGAIRNGIDIDGGVGPGGWALRHGVSSDTLAREENDSSPNCRPIVLHRSPEGTWGLWTSKGFGQDFWNALTSGKLSRFVAVHERPRLEN